MEKKNNDEYRGHAFPNRNLQPNEDLEVYRAIFENNSAAIAILEPDTTISMVNNAFCCLSGYSEEELIGESWVSKMPESEIERLVRFNRSRLLGYDNVPDKYEFIFHKKTGEKRYGLLSASTLQSSNKTIVSFTDITERKEAEEAQRVSKEHYRSLVEYANDVVYSITIEGIITYASPNWAELLGHELDEVIGHSFIEFVHPDDIEHLGVLIQQSYMTAQKLSGIRYKIRHKRGHWLWYSSSSSPIVDAEGKVTNLIGISHDITQNKITEEALQKSEALLDTLVKTIPDLVWLKDQDGTYLLCNTMFENFFGAPKSEIIGKTDYDFVDKELADLFRSNDLTAIEKGGPSSNEEWVTFASDGHKALLDTIKTPMYTSDGKLIGVLGISRDITLRKEYEQSLRKSESQLKELNATKDKFFSIIAHDLRNPFSILLGLSEIMADENNRLTPDELRENSSLMYKTASSTFNLLENLLEWSRLQRGLSLLKKEKVEMKSFVINLLESFSETASRKSINLSCKVATDLIVEADRNMLHTILRNLVTNAIKFTNIGGTVSINANRTNGKNEVLVIVKDNGIGIPVEMIDNLFRIDVNVTRPGTQNEHSSGLGLILCKEFVEMHGGRIWVESDPVGCKSEKGTTFFFTLCE